MELYGSPTTKELKKKHSSRLVGGAEMGSWAEKVVAVGPGQAKLQLASKVAAGGLGKAVGCGLGGPAFAFR